MTDNDKQSIYWCRKCKIPIIRQENEERQCPECGGRLKYLSKDIRPVFAEERLLLEIIKGKPLAFVGKSVWANRNVYTVDGEKVHITSEELRTADIARIRAELERYGSENTAADIYHERFIKANGKRLAEITEEAHSYIKEEYAKNSNAVVAFSGGKDSTATSALVMQALGQKVPHIFIDTTLEAEQTLDYVEEYKNAHPDTEFIIRRNEDNDFYTTAEQLGPPSHLMRWCCTMFKTGIVNRVYSQLFNSKKVLTFYGIRKCESTSRSKYNRTEDKDGTVKVAGQRVASPIFYWRDSELWLFLLAHQVPFNYAYRLGYHRVGCYNCPNSSDRQEFLTRLYQPEKAEKWRNFLIDFATKIGKENPAGYADSGGWKARAGGEGTPASKDIKVRQTNCTTQENAKVYELNKPLTDDFYDLFIPFGTVSKELGRKLIGEVLVLDKITNIPFISIQPFKSDYEHAVKIAIMNVEKTKQLEQKIEYQVRKYNACRKCLKCEAVCKFGAININGRYEIDADKCRQCKMCCTSKYLTGGCMLSMYVKTKKGGYDYGRA